MCSIVNEFVERAMTLFNIYFIMNRLVRAIVTSAIKNIRKKMTTRFSIALLKTRPVRRKGGPKTMKIKCVLE